MVVAAGALQTCSEEDLGGVRRDLVKLIVPRLPVPIDGRRVLPFSGRGNDAANEFVIGAVAGNVVLDPVVKGISCLVGPCQVAVAKDGAPAEREEGRIVG